MDHNDHVGLLRPADLPTGGVWADFGAGTGAFTLALRQLTGPEAVIYAIDRDRTRLSELERAHRDKFASLENLHILNADFTHPLGLPALDGAIMANSLHFFKDKEKILHHVRTFLKTGGVLLVVEYNTERGNPWVPHPLSFETFRKLAPKAGFEEPALIAKRASSFMGEFYTALASPVD